MPEWNTSLSETAITPTADVSSNLETTMAIIEPEIVNEDSKCQHCDSTCTSNSKEIYNGVVRVAASYDMGYSTKRSGRTYDSLNGYAAFLGRETGKAIEYFTTNRGCRMCALGHPQSDHDCGLNFMGSAKAMEPFAATSMTSKSSIFKEHNIEVGILIGDDDSSTIAAVRAASKSQVIKNSDKNHTSRGVANKLYKYAKVHKELKGEAVTYLYRCFTYALSQNAGNSKEVAKALRNIPEHTFNNHDSCGHWCRYAKDPSSYEHSVIKGGFQSPDLYKDIKFMFNSLADDDRFAAGASSQANESLNATMTSHYPKSRCYSQTASGDFRFGCAIGEKNLGEGYFQEAATKKLLSPGLHTTKYVNRRVKVAKRRYLNTKRSEFKKRRLFLKEQRSSLRKKKEDTEGTQYESNMGLLSTNAVHDSVLNTEGINEEIIEADDEAQLSEPIAVFFDLETSSFSKQSDILQIAAQYKKSTFSVYVNPTQKIAVQASEANGLTNIRGELMLNGTRVPSIPLRLALDAFRNFLTKLKHPVVLVAHNCKFDAPILINSVKKMALIDDFGSVVVGFADTLPLIKSVTNHKGKGMCTLTGLASWLEISADGAHNAVFDVVMLVKITENLQITTTQILNSKITWKDTIANVLNAEKSPTQLKTLIKLGNCISAGMKKKIADADINYEDLIRTYRENGDAGIIKLFGKDENDKVRVTKSKKIINNLLTFLKTKAS